MCSETAVNLEQTNPKIIKWLTANTVNIFLNGKVSRFKSGKNKNN